MLLNKKGIVFIFLTFLFSSCSLATMFFGGGLSSQDNKINYHEEKVFSLQDLGYPNNGMYSYRAIDYDSDNIYCITWNDELEKSSQGVLVKTNRDGSDVRSVVLCDEVRRLGYDECRLYDLTSINLYDDFLIVSGEESILFPCYTELVCLNKNTLEVLWYWQSAEGGWNAGISPTRWNDKYVFIYKDSKYRRTSWLTILDKDGHMLITRRFSGGGTYDNGNLSIEGDRLYIRTSDSPYTVYDLNLLLDSEKTDSECILFQEKDRWEAGLFTSLISDGINAYLPAFCDEEKFTECIASYNICNNSLRWRTELEGTYKEVHGIITLHQEKLYIPADYGSVYCMDALTGKQLWHTDIRKKPDEAYDVNLFTKPIVVSDKWLCVPCNSSQELLVLDAMKGDVVARIPISLAPNNESCFSEGDCLYLAASHALYRFTFKEK